MESTILNVLKLIKIIPVYLNFGVMTSVIE